MCIYLVFLHQPLQLFPGHRGSERRGGARRSLHSASRVEVFGLGNQLPMRSFGSVGGGGC
jgi:hypothetical protein